jgi:hypothetical protein
MTKLLKCITTAHWHKALELWSWRKHRDNRRCDAEMNLSED